MTIYYQDEHVTLHHGDCRDVMALMPNDHVASVLTDPPYTDRTHQKARATLASGVKLGVQEFTSITDDDLRTVLTECGRVAARWVVATLDYRHAIAFDNNPPDGLKSQRVGVWVKTNPTPQLTGDRPGQGWEAISYLHKAKGRSHWNGGGRHGNYVTKTAEPTGHPTTKPVHMLEDWVRLYTDNDETVLDPFAGSGTTLVAARNLGRQAIGVEMDESYCELIANRLSQTVMDFTTL